MGRIGRKIKRFFGRVGKGIKQGAHKVIRFIKGANDAYERGKQFVDKHQGDIDKAKDLARKYGGKYGQKGADAIDKGQSYYKKATDTVDKYRDKAKSTYEAVKGAVKS